LCYTIGRGCGYFARSNNLTALSCCAYLYVQK
jgi:hypothetical protein